MAKKQSGGTFLPLPFTTFSEIAALGFRARVYCSGCYDHRAIDPAADHLRDRCFATTRFRCTKIRYTEPAIESDWVRRSQGSPLPF
jgi:hypothetical protein